MIILGKPTAYQSISKKRRDLHASSLCCLLQFSPQLSELGEFECVKMTVFVFESSLDTYENEASELYTVFIKGPGNPQLLLVQLNPSTLQRNRLHPYTAI